MDRVFISFGGITIYWYSITMLLGIIIGFYIALKEADESHYWLKKLHTGGYLKDSEFESMEKDVIEIIKLLTSIIKTKKRNTESLDSHK